MAVARPLKALVTAAGIRYSCYKIFALDLRGPLVPPKPLPGYRCAPITQADVANAGEPLIRAEAWYGEGNAIGFGVYRGAELVCLQWIWHGKDYHEKRNFWPLAQGEAKSVQLVTVPAEHNKGLATLVKLFSAGELSREGFRKLYSRIWWSNKASMRVSEKAGWHHIATVYELQLGAAKPLRMVLGAKPLQVALGSRPLRVVNR